MSANRITSRQPVVRCRRCAKVTRRRRSLPFAICRGCVRHAIAMMARYEGLALTRKS